MSGPSRMADTCPGCGYRVPASMAQCPSCGRPLAAADDAASLAPPAPPTLPAWAEGVNPDALPDWARPSAGAPPSGSPPSEPPPSGPAPSGPPAWSAPPPAPPGPAGPAPWSVPGAGPGPPPGPSTAWAPGTPPGSPPGWGPGSGPGGPSWAPPPPGASPGTGPWGPAPPPWGAPQWPATPSTDGVAIAALVVGLVSLVTFPIFLPAVAAIILAVIAATRLRRAGAARKGQGLAIGGAVVGSLSIIGGVALWVAVAHTGVFSGNLVSYTNLQAGDCIDMPHGIVRLYHRYPCDQPHDREVTGEVLDPSSERARYPGTQALTTEGATQCRSVSDTYVGGTVDRTRYLGTFLYPRQLSWDNGERRILCLIGNRDGSKLASSVH